MVCAQTAKHPGPQSTRLAHDWSMERAQTDEVNAYLFKRFPSFFFPIILLFPHFVF